jgi:recombination protein RecA
MARKTLALSPAKEIAARINAQMKDTVVTVGDDTRYTIQRVPTGSYMLDRLTGGGFARGRHIELFGDWLTGKSLMAYRTLILAQQRGEVCAVVDAEGVFSEKWFAKLGGKPKDLILYRAANANQLGNVLQLFVQSDEHTRAVDIVLIDSVASLLPLEELRHDFEEGDARVASLARLMSLLLRKITTQNDKTLFIWTNQWRDKISRIPGQQSTPGGRALGFYASTRIEMAWGEREIVPRKVILKGKEVERKVVLGRWVTCTLRKEKTGARPEDQRSFFLSYDTRLPDPYRELVDLGMEDGVVERRGDYFIYTTLDGEEVKCHGINRMTAKLEGDEELREELASIIEESTAEIGGL